MMPHGKPNFADIKGPVLGHFGTAVTVIEMQARLIAREDEDVSAAVAEILEH